MIGLILFVIFEPHLLCWGLKHGLIMGARLAGKQLSIGKLEGSVFEPLTFSNVAFHSAHGGITASVNIPRAEAHFSWKALAVHQGKGFLDKLVFDGLRGEIGFGTAETDDTDSRKADSKRSKSPWLPVPTQTVVRDANVALHLKNRALVFKKAACNVSTFEAGQISIGSLEVQSDRINKKFTGLRGTTAIQDARLVVADLKMDEGIRLNSLSTDLNEAAQGLLQIDFDFAAFEGVIRGDLLHALQKKQRNYEITGRFWNISVPALASFLNVHEKTGGTIKEGQFTFRGSPQALNKATVSTRLEATDFLWGKRQWNSLIMGATIVDRHIQIPELELQQAHNALKVKGELTLPEDDSPWWLSDFNFDVAGRINNLTELSTLFGPHFANTSGVVSVDGSIHGAKKIFSGQLLVHGSTIKYRGAPIDVLNAGIKLDGNEFQVVNLELVHGADYVRGKGAINILGERRYSGELRASVADLAEYAALFEKPVAPAPLAGGLVVDWSGDGAASAHSGAFTAQLRKFRSLGSKEVPATLPIDADLQGTYAPGGLWLSKCSLANADTRLDTRVTANISTVKFEGLKLTQKNVLWVEGDAELPLNLWNWWTAPGMEAITQDAPFKVQLNARGVQLEEVAHLTGRPIPVSGLLTGSLHTQGTLRDPKMSGSVRLSKGRLPENDWLPALEAIEADAEVDGSVLRMSKFSARHAVGQFTATGTIDLSKIEAPLFDLLVHGEKIRFASGNSWAGTANLDIVIAGSREASVTGGADLLSLETCPQPDFGALISTGSIDSVRIAAPTFALPAPMDRWNYNIAVINNEPVKTKTGTVAADLHLSGIGKSITATGSVSFSNLPLGTTFAYGKVESATFFLGEQPALVAHLSGRIDTGIDTGKTLPDFEGYYFGPLDHLSGTFAGERKEDDETIQSAFTPGVQPLSSEAGEIRVDMGPLVFNEAAAKLAAEQQAKNELAQIPAASDGSSAAPTPAAPVADPAPTATPTATPTPPASPVPDITPQPVN
ncbi:MAG: hypothetical protein WCP06_11795 [Verrucomicrobiota bacterium]